MSWVLTRLQPLPLVAASNIAERTPVQLDTTARQVLPAATNNVRPFGVALTTASAGKTVKVLECGNVVKAIANASIGAGAELAVASSNGSLGPAAGASGVTRWSVGQSMETAAAGETFSLLVCPRQISNLI